MPDLEAAARMKLTLPPVYPITDKKLARRESHFSILKELVRGGAQLVQIRDKSTPLQELLHGPVSVRRIRIQERRNVDRQ